MYCRQRHGKKENQMGRRAEKGRSKGVGGNKGEKGREERGKKVRRGKRKKKGTGKTQKVWHQQVKSSQAQPHAALTTNILEPLCLAGPVVTCCRK